MPPKAQKETIFVVRDEDHFRSLVSEENKKLVIIDVHLDWCGPCKVIQPNFRTLFFSISEAEKRIEFFTMNDTIIPDDLKPSPDFEVKCSPKFLIYLEGELKAEISGADFAKINDIIDKQIPVLDEA